MKKLFFAGLSVLFAGLMLASCGSEEPKPNPTPKEEMAVEILLNGKAVKDGSVVESKGIHMPETEDEKQWVKDGAFDYDFKDQVTIKAKDKAQLGTYTVEASKIGGEEVFGNLFQVCLIGKTCSPINDNKFDKDNQLEVTELNKSVGYEFYYRIGSELPKEAMEASVAIKVKQGDKLISKFTIKMTYKP